jgi:hypothetical protein
MDPEKYFADASPKHKISKNNKSEFYVPSIPIPWLKKIYVLPGASLKVALIIWRTYRMENSQNTFKLTKKYCEPFEISRYQRFRGLRGLEEAGLIEVDQKPGRAPVITLLNIKK